MTMDVQDLAMFVRDPGSVVTCILLPLSASMHMHQQVHPSQHVSCCISSVPRLANDACCVIACVIKSYHCVTASMCVYILQYILLS